MEREQAPDDHVAGRFLAAASALDGHDRRAALRAHRDLLSWTCEDHEEPIFRTREKYAAEKRRLVEFNNRPVPARCRRRCPDRFVREARPERIFAATCEHGLLPDLLPVGPMDGCSATHGRPEGPCRGTRLEVAAAAQMLDRFARR